MSRLPFKLIEGLVLYIPKINSLKKMDNKPKTILKKWKKQGKITNIKDQIFVMAEFVEDEDGNKIFKGEEEWMLKNLTPQVVHDFYDRFLMHNQDFFKVKENVK